MRKSNVHTDRIPLLPVEEQEVKNNGIWLNSEKSTCKICKALSFLNLGVSKVTSKIISCLDFPVTMTHRTAGQDSEALSQTEP